MNADNTKTFAFLSAFTGLRLYLTGEKTSAAVLAALHSPFDTPFTAS